MLERLQMLGHSYLSFLNFWSIVYGLGGALLGILVGCMPGLSATLCIALLTTLTIKMAPNDAILILICAYVGTLYGGSRTAIVLNIPGTAANAADCLDGHALARQGRAGRAMGIATTGSVAGSLFGVLCLAMFTPLLAETALKFGALEFFWLGMVGIMMSGGLSGEDALKGWLMGLLGLFVATIGLDPIHAQERFTFGQNAMSGGIALIPALVGAFGFAEILTVMNASRPPALPDSGDSVLPRIADLVRHWRTVIRSGLIGVFVGILPGVGEDMAAWSSYAAAKRASKEKEEFGKGSVDGLIAAETGDNASIPGALIPALALGIPGSAPAAVLMAAMIIHGAQPGPMLMVNQPQYIYDVVGITLLATLAILLFGLILVRPILWVLRVPREVIMPIVFVLCVLGSYSITQRLFDVWVMLATGIVCFLLRRQGFPVAPFVLGLVLGDIVDKSLRRGLVLSDGSLLPFFTRPISALLALLVLAMLAWQFASVRRWFGAKMTA